MMPSLHDCKVLVTGAKGFVGSALRRRLTAAGQTVVPAVRNRAGFPEEVAVGEISPLTDWRSALTGCEAVVHLAARVHVLNDAASNPLALYRATNTEATLNLARQAAQAGVKRFVFISSIKVNGEGRDTPYREGDVPAPEDAYAISKWEAEQGLHQIAQETGLQVVVLRPPLVYGPGVGANFLRLMGLVERGVPLPFGAIDNRRSMIYLGNLVDAIAACLTHPTAAGKTYLVSDGEDVSTSELIGLLAAHMGKRARLLPVHPRLLELAAGFVGKSAEMRRLLGSLLVDSSLIRRELGWQPAFSMQEGLAATVEWFRERQKSKSVSC